MNIPHRRSTQIALFVFSGIVIGATVWACIALQSAIPLGGFVVGALVLWQISQVTIQAEIRSDRLVTFQAFSERSALLGDLRKVIVDSGDAGTVTLHFLDSKVRLMQGAKTTRKVIDQIRALDLTVEILDPEGRLSSESKKD